MVGEGNGASDDAVLVRTFKVVQTPGDRTPGPGDPGAPLGVLIIFGYFFQQANAKRKPAPV